MTTTVNNTIENNAVVANNVANNEDGYNANIVNEVVVVNEKKFEKRYFVIGQKYRFGSHYFHFTQFETDDNNHCNWHGILDGKEFVGTSHEWKNACECDYRRPKNQPNSANDTENGKAVKVKRTGKETADQIKAKYADTIEKIKDKVGKLQADERILNALNTLCDIIDAAAKERIETITNAEKTKQAERLNRIEELFKTLPDVQGKAVVAMGNGDFRTAGELAKQAEALKTELDALQAEETAYLASLAPASEDAEDAEAETAEDNK